MEGTKLMCLLHVRLCVYPQPGDRSSVVYERGCLRAGEEWVEVNLVPVAGVAVGIAILQVWYDGFSR
jgi:hypothetical protein